MCEVFTFKIYLCTTEIFCEASGKIKRSWSSYICLLELAKFLLEFLIFFRCKKCLLKLFKRGDEGLGDKTPSIDTEVPSSVR